MEYIYLFHVPVAHDSPFPKQTSRMQEAWSTLPVEEHLQRTLRIKGNLHPASLWLTLPRDGFMGGIALAFSSCPSGKIRRTIKAWVT